MLRKCIQIFIIVMLTCAVVAAQKPGPVPLRPICGYPPDPDCCDIYGCEPLNSPPTVSLSASPTSGWGPLNVSFVASAADSDGYITSTVLYFGDGQAASDVTSAVHTYAAAGTYYATFTATITEIQHRPASRSKSLGR